MTCQCRQCRHCHRRRWGIIGGFLRFIGLLAVLVLVFAAGLVVGAVGPRFVPFHAGPGEPGDIAQRVAAFTGDGGAFNLSFGEDERQFGVITAIAGQSITIADNGGGTQTVLVDSDTVVMDGDREIPVWNLRKGYSVRIHGDKEDTTINAARIEVIR